MTHEGQAYDRKSIRVVTAKSPRWRDLAKDCVAFANSHGGVIDIGIEDDSDGPPAGQIVSRLLVDKVRTKICENAVNVSLDVMKLTAANSGESIRITVARSHAPASTTRGEYFIRVGDESRPLIGEEIQRLMSDRTAQPWETLSALPVPRARVDRVKLERLLDAIRSSERTKTSVREKTDQELLDHYLLAIGDHLTNLGILCAGMREDRARLGTAPIIQFIKYDEHGSKVNKIAWDDFDLSPMELVRAVWDGVPDFRETYELPDGLLRQNVPAYDEVVVRELLVNAIVHRPYTQQGDIFLNLHPDRLEIVNPGRLPVGVTPKNILHTTVRRNDHMARLFHDLKLMEREGSGYDKIYELLLSQGRAEPVVREGEDSVAVTVYRRVIKAEVIDFIEKASRSFGLSQRERICLGLLAQHDSLRAKEICDHLNIPDVDGLAPWMGRLPALGIVQGQGRTQARRYFIESRVLRETEFQAATTLARIEPYRLDALVVEDLGRYPGSGIGKMVERIGPEIPRRELKKSIDRLVAARTIRKEGQRRWTRYFLVPNSIDE